MTLDQLDLALLDALRRYPRAGALELSRRLGVARATVTARQRRLQEAGVVTGYGPDVNLAAAGYPVRAFVTLEIAQGALTQIAEELAAIPGVVEAYATTGSGDVLCHVAAASHQDLQAILVRLNHSPAIDRSTSVIALSTVVERQPLRALAQGGAGPARSPAFRAAGQPDPSSDPCSGSG
jgi:DNA-binding Lrp family transcriptional regulator